MSAIFKEPLTKHNQSTVEPALAQDITTHIETNVEGSRESESESIISYSFILHIPSDHTFAWHLHARSLGRKTSKHKKHARIKHQHIAKGGISLPTRTPCSKPHHPLRPSYLPHFDVVVTYTPDPNHPLPHLLTRSALLLRRARFATPAHPLSDSFERVEDFQ